MKKHNSSWKNAAADALCVLMTMGFLYYAVSDSVQVKYNTIYTHKISIALSSSKYINYISDGDELICSVPSGSKIETTKAQFSQHERPKNPVFEVKITYPEDSFINDGYVSYSDKITGMVSSSNNGGQQKQQCHQESMMVGGEWLSDLIKGYHNSTVFVAPATLDYYL